jgi:hypothetical protein
VSLSSRLVVGPATLEQRLQAVRNKRMASRLSRAVTVGVWVAALTALVIVAVAGLLDGH